MDISEAMLDVGLDRDVEGDMCLQDLGQGLPLRPGSFDGAISISAVQWLCNADSAGADPRRRMRRFFESLYASLTRGGRAALQACFTTHTQQQSCDGEQQLLLESGHAKAQQATEEARDPVTDLSREPSTGGDADFSGHARGLHRRLGRRLSSLDSGQEVRQHACRAPGNVHAHVELWVTGNATNVAGTSWC